MSRLPLCLALALLFSGCREEADQPPTLRSDTVAPIGTGTELLLTHERLALLEDWIRASIARNGVAPPSLDDLRPPEADAALYAPLGRFLRDGWGREIEYEYVRETRSYELRSAGEDAVVGTPDDVTRRGQA